MPDEISRSYDGPADEPVPLPAWAFRSPERTTAGMNGESFKDVLAAAANATLVSVESCCRTPGKFCAGDVWGGNLEAFARHLLRALHSASVEAMLDAHAPSEPMSEEQVRRIMEKVKSMGSSP